MIKDDSVIASLVKSKTISEEDSDLYLYALKVVTRGVINFLAVIVMGLAFGMLKESLVIFGTFFILRKFVGGLHAEKYLICFFSSLAIFAVCLIAVRYADFISILSFGVLTSISFIMIAMFSPVKHPNKIMDDKEIVIYKIISIILAAIITITSIACVKNNIAIGYSLATGQIIVTLLMIIGKVKYAKA